MIVNFSLTRTATGVWLPMSPTPINTTPCLAGLKLTSGNIRVITTSWQGKLSSQLRWISTNAVEELQFRIP